MKLPLAIAAFSVVNDHIILFNQSDKKHREIGGILKPLVVGVLSTLGALKFSLVNLGNFSLVSKEHSHAFSDEVVGSILKNIPLRC
jgi:hypothetical protein